jgi:chromosome partitioning protein
MQSVAVYSLKGGVGKTTLAASLAWAAATRSARRTLLWDLDPQSAASFLLGAEAGGRREAQAVFAKDVDPAKLIRPTAIPRLDLLPADASLRGLDRFLFGLGKKKRLLKLIESVGQDYDRIILDAPPGLTETSEQVLRAADLIIVPVIPSPLSQRALDEVVGFLDRNSIRRGPILPIYNMVDRRRSLHRAALEAHPDWPAIPMASAFEAMSAAGGAVGRLAPSSPAATALFALWAGVEKRLAKRARAG